MTDAAEGQNRPGSALKTRTEEIASYAGLPLRLSFEPQAIREHFEDDPDYGASVAAATDEQLAHIGMVALESDRLYEVFHELLCEGSDALPDV